MAGWNAPSRQCRLALGRRETAADGAVVDLRLGRVEERICMRSLCFRHPPRPLRRGVLVSFSLRGPALAADKHTKTKQNGVESEGMYSNYLEKGHAEFDKYLGDTRPLTEAELVPALLSA